MNPLSSTGGSALRLAVTARGRRVCIPGMSRTAPLLSMPPTSTRFLVFILVLLCGCSSTNDPADANTGSGGPSADAAPAADASFTPAETAEPLRLWENPAVDPPRGEWFNKLPWLSNISSWISPGCGRGQPREAGEMGDMAVGNGRVFALTGYACPLNTLHNITGPEYQKEKGFFPDWSLRLTLDGAAVRVSAGHLFRVRGTGVLISREQAENIELQTITFAPWTGDALSERMIVRIVTVRNTGTAAVKTEVMAALPESRENRTAFLLVWGPGGVGAEPNGPIIGQTLAPGSEYSIAIAYLLQQRSDPPPDRDALAKLDPAALLEETRRRWQSELQDAVRLESPDPRVADLLETQLVTQLTQRDRRGGVSPMSQYTKLWTRDSIGPVRFLLAAGMHRHARDVLNHYWRAMLHEGDVSNSYRLDTPEGDFPQSNWDQLPPLKGREAAEGPSYAVLMHLWALDAAGDRPLFDSRYGFLKRMIMKQQINGRGLLPFSNDETYRTAMSIAAGQPLAFDFTACCDSANSSFLYAAAAEGFAMRAEASNPQDAAAARELAKRVRDAAEQTYWTSDNYYAPWADRDPSKPPPAPFEDVSSQPIWSGYLQPDNPRARANLDAVWKRLGNDEGFLQSPMPPQYKNFLGMKVEKGVYTGMSPGYTLRHLTAMEHPAANKAFNSLNLAASGSGNYGEYQIADRHAVLQITYDARGDQGDYTARYRPWEGGVNIEAMLHHLTGFTPHALENRAGFSPHLPNGWPRMKVSGLRMGARLYDVEITGSANRRSIILTQTAGEPAEAALEIPILADRPALLMVNGSAAEPAGMFNPFAGAARIRLPAHHLSAGQSLRAEARW
ncbi:MAG: hypothetical protein GMKNLPBB_00075 [Myxococcota bacterium]|nr:hypothetical protein [Myxococcota bacterium]